MKSSKLKLAAILVALGMVPASVMAATATGTLNVAAAFSSATANVVVAGPIDFGTTQIDGANTPNPTSTTTFTVTVTNGVAYTLNLDGGLAPGVATNTRNMSDGGTNTLEYFLFQDTGLVAYWDTATPVSASGTGSAQTYTVFGASQKPTLSSFAGSYTDTVTITVAY
ncbi:MAG: spore coat protein U domain-containing protein [Nitrosomonadales bacterium]|nr:spore coat protein U domain-containing protein [Nitrosomonadales bacterium]